MVGFEVQIFESFAMQTLEQFEMEAACHCGTAAADRRRQPSVGPWSRLRSCRPLAFHSGRRQFRNGRNSARRVRVMQRGMARFSFSR